MNITRAGTEETHGVHTMRFFVTGNKRMRGNKTAQYPNGTGVGKRSRREWEREHCFLELGKCGIALKHKKLESAALLNCRDPRKQFSTPSLTISGPHSLTIVVLVFETTNPFQGN